MILELAILLASQSDYRLVWSDEFNVEGPPNSANWSFETGFVRNEELQWYQPQNATCKNGLLVIEARREHVPNPSFEAGNNDWRKNREFADYTSACIKSVGKRQFTFGRFEVRAKIDARKGLWPAIWTLGNGPWPLAGEIDLMEFYQDTILANTCYGNGVWNTGKTPYSRFLDRDKKWGAKFHVWRMDWDEKSIKLFLDDELLNSTDVTKTINPDGSNPFHGPQYILLNLAIGSTGGDPTATSFPSRFEVDYVRVFQHAKPAKKPQE